ncbi:imelysin family protein [Fulvivirgaceae bacterium BMA12]|uniref:Imelysin family protein n=1 Tax=Agaribacillus aureus TaxID=3051825 RepID=A0ABT8L5L5_9BACT|nr:imelysin family protein [Fulvivirgaceae bacterium BMA12]
MKAQRNNIQPKFNVYLLTILLLILFGSCSEDGGDGNGNDDFDRVALLNNIGKNIILPNYQSFYQETSNLKDAAMDFAANPSAQLLTGLQTNWKAATLAWKNAEVIDLGPIDQLALKTSIDNWPTNTIAIGEALTTTKTIDNAYITSLGSSSKGLPAIEYLIFDPEGGNQTVLDAMATSTNRLDYLVALCENLHSLAKQLFEAWDPASDNYLNTFMQADGKDIGSSINMLANNVIFLAEIVKNEKIGVPLGKKSLGELLPKNAEAWRSQSSLSFILENLKALKSIYKGADGEGFDDYLNHINARYLQDESLSQVIDTQFDSAIEATEAISLPLTDALTQEKDKVELAFEKAQQLVILLKTDMMSSLGLLVTFSDNDGD